MFTPEQAYALVRRNGGTRDEAIFLASVMRGESGGDPAARNSILVDGHNATGLFQVVDYPARTAAFGDLTNPDNNAKAAISTYRGQGPGAWTAPRNTADAAAATAEAGKGDNPSVWESILKDSVLGPVSAIGGAAADVAGAAGGLAGAAGGFTAGILASAIKALVPWGLVKRLAMIGGGVGLMVLGALALGLDVIKLGGAAATKVAKVAPKAPKAPVAAAAGA